MENISTFGSLGAEPVLNDDIKNAAALHQKTMMGACGKVSAATGWKAVLRGELFGHGKQTELTGNKLLEGIASTHGQNIADTVARQLGVSQADRRPLNSYKVAKAVAMVEAASDWTKVHESTIQYTPVSESNKKGNQEESSKQCQVKLIPLGLLASLKHERGLLGVSSTDTNNNNAVNGWVEEVTLGEEKSPTTSFIRSGILMPSRLKAKGEQEIGDVKEERKGVALNRYKQILLAMVETNLKLDSATIEKNSQEHPLSIEHAHIGLLSANQKKELEMAEDQCAFIKEEVHDKVMKIFYQNKEGEICFLWVKPTVRYTNFSVQKAEKETAAISEERQGLLNQSGPDSETEKTLDHYLGTSDRTGAIIEEKITNLDAQKKQEVTRLVEELRALRPNRSRDGASFYSYEFQTKYSLLLAQCGIPTHVYCKSGKDRTSRFSEMIKMWAANPGLKLEGMTRAKRNLIKAFSFSGNKMIQRLCTGFAGNKQFKTYWRLIAGEKKDRTFGGWTHLFSAGSYSGWGASTIVKT